MLEYHAAFYKIEDGWYFIRLLDFPGVITQGRNLREARYMIRDCLELVADLALEEGKPLPRPNPRARDKKAVRLERVRLTVKAL